MAFTNNKNINVGTFVRLKQSLFNKVFGNLPSYDVSDESSLGLVVRYDNVPTMLEVLCEEKIIVCHIDDLEKVNVDNNIDNER